MIQLVVEVSDLDCEDSKVLTLPCNLKAELDNHYDYIILSTSPDIHISRNDCIGELNDILDEINSENPGMTAEYLKILLESSPSGDLFNEEFVRKLRENEFMFCDISGLNLVMDAKETAGYYLATEHRVPFDYGITDEAFDVISNEIMVDYINWRQIWEQYECVGFRLIERTGTIDGKKQRYIVHIK